MKYFETAIKIDTTIKADTLASLIINRKIDVAKISPEQLVKDLQSQQSSKVSDEGEITKWIDEALAQLPQAVADFKSGKQQAIGVIIGKVMQLSKGKADARQVSELIKKRLSS